MNRFPAWLNWLVLFILLTGCLFALPNIYGSAPAIQLASVDAESSIVEQADRYAELATDAGVAPESVYTRDGRVVLRFEPGTETTEVARILKDRVGGRANVAQTLAPNTPAWVRDFGLNPMSLGLDLRGGVYVLLEVDMETAIETRMASYRDSFVDELGEKARGRHRVTDRGESILVELNAEADLAETRSVIARLDPDLLIAESADGRSLTVRMSDTQIQARQDFAIEQNMTTLRNRVDALGVAEPLVQRQGVDRIIVQLPGVDDPNELIGILGETATIEFRMVDQTADGEPGSRVFPGRGSEPSVRLKRRAIATGDQIIDAAYGTFEGAPQVNVTLDSVGGARMLETTMNNVGKPMSTVFIETKREPIPGRPGEFRKITKAEVINTARINGVFKDKFRITGLSGPEGRKLALLLKAGALAAPVYVIDQRTIGPSLGQDNIDRGFNAIAIGFLAVIVFMAIYYRAFGLIANVALLSNLVFIVAMLSALGASLTLPGIAGIVLTVGMAVDANVLIFERIREELSAGASPQAAINSGYEKALSSIADANITTLIAAIVLLAVGTGPVKGFAITLMLGIITSMFTAIIGTRTIVNLLFGGRKISSVPV